MIVENVDRARIALAQAALMDRRKVRRRFEERFTARRMANDYVRIFRSLIRRAPQSANDLAIRRERMGPTDLVSPCPELCPQLIRRAESSISSSCSGFRRERTRFSLIDSLSPGGVI
jgi:hypothetical protein